MKKTVKYYEENALNYLNETQTCNMSHLYSFFLKYLSPSDSILDIGFGSGRDMLEFKKMGFQVFGIDPTPMFVKNAKKLGLNVLNNSIEEYQSEQKYDGIWACASLLHIEKKDLSKVLKKCAEILKENGTMYASFKYGEFAGERNNRYFNDLNENSIKKYLLNTGLILVEFLITKDVRKDRSEEKWLNVTLKKTLS